MNFKYSRMSMQISLCILYVSGIDFLLLLSQMLLHKIYGHVLTAVTVVRDNAVV